MIFLKQSTAVDILFGPFLDETDGKTAETGLTVTQAEVRLSKNGGNMAQKAEATSLVHDELGYYVLKLDTDDTDTLGILKVMVHESGALPVWETCMVTTANIWDSLFGADMLQADLTQIGGVAQSATDLKDFADAGYDPNTNKVTGCKLTDEVTTVTDGAKSANQLTDATWTDARAGYLDELAAANLITDVSNIATEVGKIPKSDGSTSWNATALGAINAEVDTALDTAVPGSPTAHSINERIKSMDVLTEASGSGDLAAILSDTNELQSDDVPGLISTHDGKLDTVDGNVDSILTDTGTTIPTAISGLNDLSAADVNAECDTALSDYDPPTKTEMDTGHGLLSTPAEVETACDASFATYDPPTKTEMDTAHALLATPAEVETAVDARLDAANTELASVPTTAGSLRQMIQFAFTWIRNKKTVTSTTESLKKEDASTELGSATLSDDGTTFSKGEMS